MTDGRNQYPQNIPTQNPKHKGQRINLPPVLFLDNKSRNSLVGSPKISISTVPNVANRNIINFTLISP